MMVFLAGISSPIDTPLVSSIQLSIDKEFFSSSEVDATLRSFDEKASPGHYGITVKQLKTIPPSTLALIANNWLAYGCIPLELKQCSAVFIPKCPKRDFRPITFSPVLLRLFSKLVLSSLAEGNTFHKYKSGFSDDRSTSSNILILQALMHLTKKSQRPLFAVSLDLRKAFDSVSHEAILRLSKPMVSYFFLIHSKVSKV
ncbi:hypothetical protein HPB48_021569 [Haemaphysalis longicornis]|uniref:Reverse transcriptase domain-containing protein n=1 Tax=Haemaphysalis longicornis TaxID=44386 RepID=A0A9J6GUG6_HAELO|nr:hypothetical protein HPB48_021569 [Haemaphysalis longicornis]